MGSRERRTPAGPPRSTPSQTDMRTNLSTARSGILILSPVSVYPQAVPRSHTLCRAANNLMRMPNRSTPALPSQRPQSDEYAEPVPPIPPQYDPTAVLDQFGAMHLGDPVARAPSAMSNTQDPVPRAGTSMSVRSVHPPSRLASLPQNTLPGSPAQNMPPRARNSSQQDAASLYSRHSSTEQDGLAYDHPDASYEGDRSSAYSQGSQPAYNEQYQYSGYPQQGWQGSGYQTYSDVYDPMAAAAPNVMGGAPQQSGYMYNGGGGSSYEPSIRSGSYASSVYSMSSAHSAPAMNAVRYYGPPLAQPGPPPDPSTEEEIAYRPPLQRSGTTASFTLRTQKSKAIDLSAPPYTKEYIDQYRQRIKADPDPEAHFAYARYLIDAAKHIGADAKDQRAVKKYRDVLIQEALKVIRRLATQGQPYDEAQFFLANCYGTGMLGLQVDHEKAYHLYLQAAKQNHPASSYRVAVCNEIGAGTRREPPRAIAFYRKAASLGDTAAMYKLGMILLNGSLGEQKNPREAIGWLRRAAEQADEENPHALHELALLHEMPNSGLVPHDPFYAKKLLTQAGQLGYTQSQFKLGQCYEFGTLTCAVDPRRSIAWYTKAAEKGNAEAELALSGWYLTGVEGVLKQSDSEAYLWARRAANKGLAKAEYAVGYYAEQGIGIKMDIEFAKRWYMRAAGAISCFLTHLYPHLTLLLRSTE
jgi:uncharacterized protein